MGVLHQNSRSNTSQGPQHRWIIARKLQSWSSEGTTGGFFCWQTLGQLQGINTFVSRRYRLCAPSKNTTNHLLCLLFLYMLMKGCVLSSIAFQRVWHLAPEIHTDLCTNVTPLSCRQRVVPLVHLPPVFLDVRTMDCINVPTELPQGLAVLFCTQ